MALSMILLGPPRIEVEGEPIEVDTRKAIALLTYLAIENAPQPRDRLVDLLWPDNEVGRARSSLRRTLSTLRTALGGRWLVTDRQTATLDLDGVAVDVLRVTALLDRHDHPDRRPCPTCAVELEPLVGVLGVEFLDGLAIRGAAPFERWMLDTAERLRTRLDRAAGLVELALANSGDLDRAVEIARQRYTRDPLREDTARALMRYEAWTGDRGGAIATYRRLLAVLDDELGVSPLDETTELYHAIVADDLCPPPAQSSRDRPSAEPVVDFPLTGRGGCLDRLERDLASQRVVVVEGGFGMGKSRLLNEIAVRLGASGHTVLRASGTPGSAEIPFGVLHQAVAPQLERVAFDQLPERVVAELSQLFPTVPPASVRPAGTKTALYDALAHTIGRFGPCTLVVDDAHWSDTASLEAVLFLVDHHREPVRLVASRTPGDDLHDGRVLTDLVRRAATVDLTGFDAAAVQELILHTGRDLDADRLLADTRGVPLLVVEALRSPDGRGAPETVGRLFESRIGALSGPAAQVLDVLVMLGSPATPSVVRSASGRSADETDAALHELIGAGLVVEAGAAVEVAYAQIGVQIDRGMTPPRRRLVHRRCAEALAVVEADPIRIARHHLEAGDTSTAAVWFERAGDAARASIAHESAIDAFGSALAAGHSDRARLHAKLAQTAMHSGDYQAAVRHYEAALAAEARPHVAFELGVLYRRLRRWDLAAAQLERIDLEDVPVDLAACAAAELAVIEARRGAPDSARVLADRALGAAFRSGDQNLLATAENAAAILGRPPGREEHLRSAAARATDPGVRVVVLNNLAASLEDAVESVAVAAEAAALADTIGDRHVSAAVHNTLADALRRAGHDDAARSEVTRSVELFAGVATHAEDLDPQVWMLSEL